jgi:hypothetical protein
MEPNAYFALYMTTLMVGIYPVTHLLLRTFMPPAASGST